MKINNVVVIGSGTMGSGIAAQLCNANIPVVLLDLKDEIVEKARERILKSKPCSLDPAKDSPDIFNMIFLYILLNTIQIHRSNVKTYVIIFRNFI